MIKRRKDKNKTECNKIAASEAEAAIRGASRT